MPNPYADGSIVIEATTSGPTEYLQFQPNALPADRWLHRRDEFDSTLSDQDIRDEYTLPPDKGISVRVVEVPSGIDIRIGTLGSAAPQAGGADLIELQDYDAVPDEWIQRSSSLESFHESE